MRIYKYLVNLLLIVLLALSASTTVSAKVASGPQNLASTGHQAESVFNVLTCQGKTESSTTAAPECSVVPKGEVWNLKATDRGNAIEAALAKSDYKDWYNVGNSHNGYFPLVDFQKGNTLVSLKSVNTTGKTWLTRMEDHIKDLGTRGATVDGNPANMVLDLRVQPGGASAASQLVKFGEKHGVNVIVKEY